MALTGTHHVIKRDYSDNDETRTRRFQERKSRDE